MATNIIPSDQKSVYDGLSNSQKLAYAYPTPLPYGISGLVFDIRGEERMEFRSEITDHWLEDNTAIHDQISLNPEKVTLTGSVGIIAYAKPLAPRAPIQTADSLPINLIVVPVITPGSTQAENASDNTEAIDVDTGIQSLYDYYLANGDMGTDSNEPNAQTKQQQVVGYLYNLWTGRALFTVETPWGIFTNMAIESCEPSQSSETENQTDISVTFKILRLVGEVLVNVNVTIGRRTAQNAEGKPSLNGKVGQTTLTPTQGIQAYLAAQLKAPKS